MTIKSDRWIRRMAETRGMIEPFEPNQIKEANGHKLVSYGTSSYGYDIRCSKDFKIFTNINSTIVDPKAFDERSFVDFHGDVCIVPPNSFALARTVEYFRIPRNVLTLCLGIPVFGRTPLPDWEAKLLGLMISEGQCDTPGHSPTFTSSDPVLVDLLAECVTAGELGSITYRACFGYRLVNHKGRGGIPERNRAHEWLRCYGLNVKAEHKFVPQAVFTAPKEAVRAFLQTLFAGDGGLYHAGESFFLEYYSKSRRLIEDVHHLLLRFEIFSLIREKQTAIGTRACSIQITDREQIAAFAERVGFYPGSVKQKRLEAEILPLLGANPKRRRSNFDTLPSQAWRIVSAAAANSATSLNRIGVVRTKPTQSLPYTIHNSTYARCGIIVNVTPLEPEWEGFVTLEFSNTTPLPAKIYANEGVAQVIFLESAADDVCETSYKDRGGKYQGQTGVTLPKI